MSNRAMNYGYLSPKGKMFDGMSGCHATIAFRFYPNDMNPTARMDEVGWWKLTMRPGSPVPKWIGWLPATWQQREFITEWCEEYNRANPRSRWSISLASVRMDLPNFCGLAGKGCDAK